MGFISLRVWCINDKYEHTNNPVTKTLPLLPIAAMLHPMKIVIVPFSYSSFFKTHKTALFLFAVQRCATDNSCQCRNVGISVFGDYSLMKSNFGPN